MFPDPGALLCYTFLYTGPAQKGELSLKVLQMTLPCFDISLNLEVAEEAELETALSARNPCVLDLVRGGSGTVRAALCQAVGRELHWRKLDAGTKMQGSVCGGTSITRWVAVADGKACTGIQLLL